MCVVQKIPYISNKVVIRRVEKVDNFIFMLRALSFSLSLFFSLRILAPYASSFSS